MSKNSGLKKYVYEAYLYGTFEECVMFTLLDFNRSQHAIAFRGLLFFKGRNGGRSVSAAYTYKHTIQLNAPSPGPKKV